MSSDRNAIQQLADQLRQLLCWQGRGAIFLVKWATSVVANRTWRDVRLESAFGGRADVICSERVFPVLTPERTWPGNFAVTHKTLPFGDVLECLLDLRPARRRDFIAVVGNAIELRLAAPRH